MGDFYTAARPLRQNPHEAYRYAKSHHAHHKLAHTHKKEDQFSGARASSYAELDCWSFGQAAITGLAMSNASAETIKHLEETTSHWLMQYMGQLNQQGFLEADFIFGAKRPAASPRNNPNSALSVLAEYGT